MNTHTPVVQRPAGLATRRLDAIPSPHPRGCRMTMKRMASAIEPAFHDKAARAARRPHRQ